MSQPTQEEFFESMGRSLETNPMLEGPSSVRLMAVIFSIAGLAILLLVMSHRRQSETAAPRALNHQRKLMREIMRDLPVDRQELRRLEELAERESVSGPMVFLLCPSLLEKKPGEALKAPSAQAGHAGE